MAKAKFLLSLILIVAIVGGHGTKVEANDGTHFIARDFYCDDLGRSHGVAKIYSNKDFVEIVDTSYIPVGFYSNNDGIYEDNGEILRIAHYSSFSDYDSEANCFTATESLNNKLLSLYASISGYLYNDGTSVRYQITPYYENDTDIICKGIFVNIESVDDDSVLIDEFIPNDEDGFIIDYSNGNIYIEEKEDNNVIVESEGLSIADSTIDDYFSEYGYIKGYTQFWKDVWNGIFG